MVPLLIALVLSGAAAGAWWLRRRRPAAGGMRAAAIDPFTISDPWRRHVQAALAAQRRYREIVRSVAKGPLHDRLTSIGGQVDHAVQECFAIARRGDELDDALRRLDVGSLDRQLQRATDDVTRTSLSAQLAAAGRVRAAREDSDSRLRIQVTRMGELTALAAEVSVGTDNTEMLGTGVGDVVSELEGLRLALQELQTPRT